MVVSGIFKIFIKGIFLSFLLGFFVFTVPALAQEGPKIIDIGTTNPNDKVNILSDLLCLNGDQNCISDWSDIGGAWMKNGTEVYYNLGNVGVGTTTPSAGLDINRTEGFRTLGQVRFAGPLYIDSGTRFLMINATGDVLASSALYSNSGNVGIGLSAPTAKLEINGQLKMTGGSPGLEKVLTSDNDGLASWRSLATIGAGPPNIAYSSGNGGVSIINVEDQITSVTITPSSINSKIIITGRFGLTKDGQPARRIGTGRIRRGITNVSAQVGRDSIVSSQNISSSEYGPFVVLAVDEPGTTNAVTYSIRGLIDSNSASTVNHYELTAYEAAPAGPKGERGDDTWTVSGVDIYRNSGNVGIGTTLPSKLLHVAGAATFDGLVNGLSPGDGNTFSFTTVDYVTNKLLNGVWKLNGSNLYASSTTWQVGIGTTNPQAALHVAGSIRTNLTGTGARCVYVDADGNLLAKLTDCGAGGVGDNLGNHIATQNIALGNYWLSGDGDGEGVFVAAGGNVGIGTTNPLQKLQSTGYVRGDSGLCIGTTCISSWANFLSGSDGQTLRHNGTSWVANSNLYNNGTNIGIGTTAPGKLLHVAGAATFDGLVDGVSPGDGNTFSFTTVEYVNGKLLNGVWKLNGSNLYASSTTWQVGIGTTNPQAALHVAGSIRTNLTGTGSRCVYVDASGNLLAKGEDCGTSSGGDNLGNHIATQNISLGNYWLSGDGDGEGVFVAAGGNVGIGTTNPLQKLQSTGYVRGDSGLCIGGTCIASWPPADLDSIIGNEVVNTTNSTLTRSGSGTTASPFTLGLNLGNANTWSAAQTFSTTTNFPSGIWNNLGNVGIGTTTLSKLLTVGGEAAFDGVVTGLTPGSSQTFAFVTVDYLKSVPLGPMYLKRTPVNNADYTVKDTDYIVAYTNLTVNRTVTIPNSLCIEGRALLIVNETNSVRSVIVDPEGATTISGYSTVPLASYNSIPMYCNGSNWFIY